MLTIGLHPGAAQFHAQPWDAFIDPDGGFYTSHRWIRSLELVHGAQPVFAAAAEGWLSGVLPTWTITGSDTSGLFSLPEMTWGLISPDLRVEVRQEEVPRAGRCPTRSAVAFVDQPSQALQPIRRDDIGGGYGPKHKILVNEPLLTQVAEDSSGVSSVPFIGVAVVPIQLQALHRCRDALVERLRRRVRT